MATVYKNLDFFRLGDGLPGDIARRKSAGDLEGAIRLIDARLSRGDQPDLLQRLRAERHRLELLPADYPFTREEAIAQVQAEWPDFSGEQFDALVEDGYIDWRYIHGQPHFHSRFLASLRLYPQLAPGLEQQKEDTSFRDKVLARMRAEGGVTASITLRATVKPADGITGKEYQVWLPIPADCPQQSQIEILDATPGGAPSPEEVGQRSIWWKERGTREYFVTYRYLHRAAYVDPFSIVPDRDQPDLDLGEEEPHIVFTPYLRALTARVTAGARGPLEKAREIYDYITASVDYRFQPAYLQLDCIADRCAKELRGDCGVMALLFITMCRIAGVPARWQSGLYVQPDRAGCHDWAMFYVAPHGWLWADCSFGSAARRQGDEARRRHYFGNLDPFRMVSSGEFFVPLTPADPEWRADPFDNQRGEMMVDGRGLSAGELAAEQEVLDFQLL